MKFTLRLLEIIIWSIAVYNIKKLINEIIAQYYHIIAKI
ncbi:hypothetical protein BMW23_1140 [Bodo saltans virus]|uniref:Uncharacterized protein n=1 Tax=Bodo saltans virus TaxID=2024608 RepID=A0A2H4UW69_9VIRU|nr:hypothetical protein QJ851_gp1120 [Bodo saltans virus]ATZ81183.1 hypothetical protein BMW23_1140 [Bodo saltans virus]